MGADTQADESCHSDTRSQLAARDPPAPSLAMGNRFLSRSSKAMYNCPTAPVCFAVRLRETRSSRYSFVKRMSLVISPSCWKVHWGGFNRANSKGN